MERFLVVLLGILVLILLAAATSVALVLRWLFRRNRVSPRVPTPAPLLWLVSWRAPARLHRRLRASVAVARTSLMPVGRSRPWPTLVALAREVEARAVALDRRLVLASRCPAASRPGLLRDLAADVAEVEALNERLVWLAARPVSSEALDGRRDGRDAGLSEVRERLDALDEALRELAPLPAGAEVPSDELGAPAECGRRAAAPPSLPTHTTPAASEAVAAAASAASTDPATIPGNGQRPSVAGPVRRWQQPHQPSAATRARRPLRRLS